MSLKLQMHIQNATISSEDWADDSLKMQFILQIKRVCDDTHDFSF